MGPGAVQRTAGLVLAAGLSRRMPGPKPLLPFGDGIVLGSAIAAAVAAGLDPVIVILGHESDRVAAAIAGCDARIGVNPDYRSGPLSTLLTGLGIAREESVESIAVLLGDEPGIQPEDIQSVVSAWRERGGLVRARYLDRPGHPVVFSTHSVPFDLVLSADSPSVWKALCRICEPASEVELDRTAPVDIDDPESYGRALADADRR